MKELVKTKKGITLIALVITIIVLLILAGVVIATLTGDNGILTNANKAKSKTELATAEEEIRLAVQEAAMAAKMDETEGKGIIDGKSAMEYELNKALTEVIAKLRNDGLTVEIDENKIVVISPDGDNSAITATVDYINGSVSIANGDARVPVEYYGKYVDYGVDLDGDATNNDWQIYYSGGGNIYLIGKQTVVGSGSSGENATNLPNKGDNYILIGDNTKCGKFNNVINSYANGSEETVLKSAIAQKWLSKYYKAVGSTKITNANIKSVAYMFDTEIWNSKFLTTTTLQNQTEYMLGGVPAELLVASYNKTHAGSDQKKLYLMSNTTGYKYALELEEPDSESSSEYVTYDGNKVLETDKKECGGIYRNGSHYWLASPSAYHARSVMIIYSSGCVRYSNYDGTSFGFRPVVSLKSNIQIEVPTGENPGSETNPYKLK